MVSLPGRDDPYALSTRPHDWDPNRDRPRQPVSGLGAYRLTFARAGNPPLPITQFMVVVGHELLWEAPPWEVMELQPAISLEYLPPAEDPVERLRKSLKELEWDKHDAHCPVCDANQPSDMATHEPGCWLAADLYGQGRRDD